jgi:hypothetical protein
MVLSFCFEGLLKEGDYRKSVDNVREVSVSEGRRKRRGWIEKLVEVQAAQDVFVAMAYHERFLNVASFFPG